MDTHRHGRHELVRRGRCPECSEEYERLAGHWKGRTTCEPPALDRRQRALVAGLLLGDGRVGGNGANKHFRLSTRWRPFAEWIFAELDWLAATVTRVVDTREERRESPPAQRYVVRTHAHPDLTPFRAWYQPPDGEGGADAGGSPDAGDVGRTKKGNSAGSKALKQLPRAADLPGGGLSSRMGRAWHATAGSLAWSDPEYPTTRQASFSAAADARAGRVMALLDSVGLDPTRAGKRVQLSPKQTTGWLDWLAEPVPGVRYKWTADREAYQRAKRDAEALRARLWYERVAGRQGPMDRSS